MTVSLPQTRDARFDGLRTAIAGRVIDPSDATYDDVRRVFVGDVDAHPAAIVRVASADDVARAIAFARGSGLEIAVRSGGHSNAGHGTVDGGLVIDLRDLTQVRIDPVGRRATAGTGLTALDVSRAADEHGLAVGFGDTGSVGIGGITLGGGIGYLVRRDGLTIDSLVAAQVVTADGDIRRVDAENEPDLFWAIRGGGGNFGVATEFEFALHDTGAVVGGILMLPATADTVVGFLEAAAAAPETVSTIANVMPAPPMPFVDPEWHGRLAILALIVHSGRVEDADDVLAPFRALATPIADLLRPIRYPEIYGPEDPDYRPLAINRTGFVDRIDRGVAGTIIDALTASDATMRVAQIRVLGGAMARVRPDATAFAHRSAPIMASVASFYEGPDDRPTRTRWVEELAAAVGIGDRAYVNFLAEEGADRVEAAYAPETWQRLGAIKRRYDPDNLFHHNQNVPPAD